MSFNIKEETFGPNTNIYDFPQDPVDLKQENMRMFDQQQNGFYLSSGYTPNNGTFANLWTSNDVSDLHNSSSLPPDPDMNGCYVNQFAPSTEDLHYVQAPVIYENGSVSSVSLPSFVTGHVMNAHSTGKAAPQEQLIDSRLPEADSGSKKKTKAKKQFLNEQEAALMEKDDSELNEKELIIKKKAQNRLAQRAFRERKEIKLKELENKLLQSEEERQKLLEKLDEIKLQYISVRTENRLLRNSTDGLAVVTSHGINLDNARFVFPKSQEEFIAEMVQGDKHVLNQETINKVYDMPHNSGRKVLAVGAVWDYLQIKAEEEEYENIDMMEVMTLLKGSEACHGYGPAYPLELVEAALRQVVEQSWFPVRV